jgi:hypothetical protein
VPADVYEGALGEPATWQWCERRRKSAGALFVVSAVMSVPGWFVVFFALDQSGAAEVPFGVVIAVMVLTCAVAVYADLRRGRLKRYRRVLGVYPWQKQKVALFVPGNDEPYVRLADPERPDRLVSVRIRRPGVRRWRGLARADAPQEVWFAGDPRIGGVVALPGPGALVLARQSGAAGKADAVGAARDGGSLAGVSEEALRRARAAGFATDKDFGGFLQR